MAGMRLPQTALLLAALACLPWIDGRELLDSAVSSQIVGGFAAKRGRYPWMASLRYSDGGGLDLRCGGSLIHPRIVMTAAHCVVDMETGQLLPQDTSLPLVRIGGYRRTLDGPADYDLRRTVRTVWHPGFVWGYKPDQLANDVALLVMDRRSTKVPVKLAPYVAKPALPVPAYTRLSALGWGWTTPNASSGGASFAQDLQEVRPRMERVPGLIPGKATRPPRGALGRQHSPPAPPASMYAARCPSVAWR